MKIKFNVTKNGKHYVIVEYKPHEFENVKKKMESLGLEVKETANAWGAGQPLKFYKEHDYELFKDIYKGAVTGYGSTSIDEINRPVIDNGKFNLAVFRAVPTNDKVEAPATGYVTLVELERIKGTAKQAYAGIMNAVGEVAFNLEIKDKNPQQEMPTPVTAIEQAEEAEEPPKPARRARVAAQRAADRRRRMPA
jgi:hypothetical protein